MLMKWLRKHRYTIFLITVGGFILGSFMGFGSYFFTISPYDAALEVNGQDISYKRYTARYRLYLNQSREQGGTLNKERLAQIKQEAVTDLVRETVFLQEAEKYGIEVTDNELAAYIQSGPAFQKDGRFDQESYVRVVTQALGMPLDEFEADRRRELKIRKLQGLLSSAVKITDPELSWNAQKTMAAGPAERKKLLSEKPDEFREQLRQEQVNNAFQEWLGQINTQLKVRDYLKKWEGRGEG
jgi:peptidyl-prolyl cis-trans isomerase D